MVTLPLHVGFHDLTPDRSMNFQLNRWINYRAETLLPDVSRIAPQLTSYRAWITVFLELPERALAEGRALDAAFHTRSAEFFMLPNDPRRRDCRERFVTLMREGYGVGARHAFRTPYAGVGLPGYRLTPPVARETIVLFGGFDSYIEEFLPVLLLLRDAGFDVVAFEGPGQGAVLEDAGLPMTPDWHRPVGAVLDHLGHANVTLVGVSLGGCLAIRAAALEPRVARVVAFDVLTDFFESLTVQTPPVMRVLLKTLMRVRAGTAIDALLARAAQRRPVVEWGIWQAMHLFGVRTAHEAFEAAAGYKTREISPLVTQDVLLCAGAEDHYVCINSMTKRAG